MPLKQIYVTHCSREKSKECEISGEKVTPDQLYTSELLQKFIKHVKKIPRYWAIFSDNYGVVFANERINWYNKPPDRVTEEEFKQLLENFIKRLAGYDEVFFFQRPGETHPLFKRIVDGAIERGLPIKEFTKEMMNETGL